jgi:hypothetical protein
MYIISAIVRSNSIRQDEAIYAGVSCLGRLKIAASLGGIILNTMAYNGDKDDYSGVFKIMKRRCVDEKVVSWR